MNLHSTYIYVYMRYTIWTIRPCTTKILIEKFVANNTSQLSRMTKFLWMQQTTALLVIVFSLNNLRFEFKHKFELD